jgi:hypothetical protein
MLFAQSRAIHHALRDFYRKEFGIGSDNVPALADDKRAAMIFLSDLFHRQIFDAIEKNPISALLSLAWTICSTCFNVSTKMTDKEYLSVWSPFICLTNVLTSLEGKWRKIDQVSIFDVDDLRLADRNFIRVIEERSKLSDEERKQLTTERINSDLFVELLGNTPFGTYQISNTLGTSAKPYASSNDREWTIGNTTFTYIYSPLNVSDRERYLVMFVRHETNDRLRRQAEERLQKLFPAYHSRYGIHVYPWMFATHEKEENGSRAMIWQMQKSALVWILYHSIGALVTVNDDRLMLKDFVATVRCMDNFVECGLCLNHWVSQHKRKWNLIAKTIGDYEQSTEHMFSLDNRTKQRAMELDLTLLVTHNDIQESIDPRLKLTEAAVYALREDYMNLARSIVLALSDRTVSDTQTTFKSSVFHKDDTRKDVCRDPWELWGYQLKRTSIYDCDVRNREYVKQALLRLEWDRYNCD